MPPQTGCRSKRTHAKTYPTKTYPDLVKTYPLFWSKRTQSTKTYPTFWSKRTQYIFSWYSIYIFTFWFQKKVIICTMVKTYPAHYFITLNYNILSTLDKQLNKKSWYPSIFFPLVVSIFLLIYFIFWFVLFKLFICLILC